MMHFVLMIGAISGLKVQHKIQKEDGFEGEYKLCSQTPRPRESDKGGHGRVRAFCNEENSDRLEDYVEVSRIHTESLSLETTDTEDVSQDGKGNGKGGGQIMEGMEGDGMLVLKFSQASIVSRETGVLSVQLQTIVTGGRMIKKK